MHEPELARARHRLYGLLGQLIALGQVEPVREAVEGLPSLAPLVDPTSAAQHHRWFSYELSAHESAFVDGALEGPATAAVRATYEAIGFHPGRRDLSPDHLGLELAAMAHLCAMEAEALADGHDAEPVRAQQQRMLGHLLAWLPLLDHAVQGPWASATGLALELAQSHDVPPPPLPLAPQSMTPTSLMVPCEVGWVCTWTALTAASDASDQPLGFGSKRRALRALLDSDDGRRALAEQITAPEGWRERAADTRARLQRR